MNNLFYPHKILTQKIFYPIQIVEFALKIIFLFAAGFVFHKGGLVGNGSKTDVLIRSSLNLLITYKLFR